MSCKKIPPAHTASKWTAWLIAFLLSNVSLLVGRQRETAALKKGLTWDDRFPTELGRANHPFSWKLEGMQALRLKYGTIIFWSPSVFNKKSRWKNYERNQAKRLNLQAEQAVGHIWRSRSSCITDAVMALHLLPWAMVAPLWEVNVCCCSLRKDRIKRKHFPFGRTKQPKSRQFRPRICWKILCFK